MATVSEATARKPRRKLNTGFDRFSGLYLWALFIIVFGIWVPDQFLTAATLHSVAAQQAVTGIVALAILIPLAAGLYDLSVGATAGLVSVTTVVLMNDHHWGPVPAIAFGMAVAIIIGCTNAFIVVRLGVNSFIATLGMSSILAATQVIVSHNAQPLPPTSTAWNNFTQTTVGGFQIVVLYMLVIAFVLWWLTAHTPTGRYLYAIGGNPEAARLSGVRIQSYTTVALVTLGHHRRRRGDHVLLAQRAVAELRRDPAAAGVRRRLPRLDAADPGALQRLGNAAGDLRPGHRRAGAAARVRCQLAERHVQRRRTDHRRRPVDPACALRPLAASSRRASGAAPRAETARTTPAGSAAGTGVRPAATADSTARAVPH